MKIGIVVPWMFRIGGNIIAINFAEELSNLGNSVDFITLEIYEGIFDTVKSKLKKSNFIYFKKIKNDKHGKIHYLYNQFIRDMGKKILTFLAMNKINYDVIFLISDEGITLGKHLKKSSGKKPITCLSVMELIEHNFFRYRDKYGILSWIIYPFYYLAHKRYKKLLSYYDLIFTNSEWTSTILNYFYGKNSAGEIQFVDDEYFNHKIEEIDVNDEYIVVPTASLGKDELQIIEKLSKENLNLKFYGPQNIGGEKYLGYLNYNDMIDLISKAKAMLFIFDYEALGLIPLEALALGTPVITYYKQGPMLSIKDCKCVTYVNDYKDIIDACKKYLNTNLSLNDRLNCRNCVEKFKSKNITMSIMKKVEDYEQRKKYENIGY